MSKSIISNDRECLICGQRYPLHKHHLMNGLSNRKKSEEDGLWCYLCDFHHVTGGSHSVHGNDKLMKDMKQHGQRKWMEFYRKDKNAFISRYGRNYID